MAIVKAYAAEKAGGELKPFEFELGLVGHDEVVIDVISCGVCHSDLSMLGNDWGITAYPFAPGHEVVGKISEVGEHVKHLKIGQTVGLGWSSRSCMECHECLSGNQNLCVKCEGTIVGRHGGFANKVKAQAIWVIPLPEAIDPMTAGPLMCGGITVFTPLVSNNISPIARVGIIGIGGLGHMAIQFAAKWGCEVAAFSTSPGKEAEVKSMGAHRFINSKDPASMQAYVGYFDMILVTVNVNLDLDLYASLLRPMGRLHFVGAAPEIKATLFPLIMGQKSLGASPTGPPTRMSSMIEFAARHGVEPITEKYKMSQVNEAMEKLEKGQPRYRLVLEADWK